MTIPTTADALALLEREPGIKDSIKAINRMRNKRQLFPDSAAIFFHYAFGLASPRKRDEFFNRLDSGTELAQDSPIYCLRERLIAGRSSKRRMEIGEIAALCIKSWHFFLTDTPTSKGKLRWMRGGELAEDFPDLTQVHPCANKNSLASAGK